MIGLDGENLADLPECASRLAVENDQRRTGPDHHGYGSRVVFAIECHDSGVTFTHL
jgi:hypothetical protein